MSYTDIITELHAELVKTRRSHGTSTSGPARNIPMLTAGDMLAVAVVLAPGVITAINRVSTGHSVPCLNERFITNGRPDLEKMTAFGNGDALPYYGVNAQQFLAGWAVDGDGARRAMTDPRLGAPKAVYTVSRDYATRGDEQQLLAFLRGTLRSWERMIDAIRSAMLAYGVGPDIGKAACTEVLASWYSLASSLDVLGENPLPSMMDDIKGAFRAAAKATGEALEEAAEVGGKAAADLANTAGKIVGNAAAGFGEGIGLAGLAVSGVVVYIVAKRYGWM